MNSAASAGQYDFNDIGLSQHEMHDVVSDTYMTSTIGRQRLAVTPSDNRAIQKLVAGDSPPAYHHLHHHQLQLSQHQQHFATAIAPCRIQQTTVDYSLGTPLTLATGGKQDELPQYASTIHGMTLIADDGRTSSAAAAPSSTAAIRYYDI
jgi:hypothetical protein